MTRIETEKNIFNNNKFLLSLFLLFPISILIGNFAINLSILLISSVFMVTLISKKNQIYIDKKTLLLLLFFFSSLIINSHSCSRLNRSSPKLLRSVTAHATSLSGCSFQYDLNALNPFVPIFAILPYSSSQSV